VKLCTTIIADRFSNSVLSLVMSPDIPGGIDQGCTNSGLQGA